jgi:dTDP-4-dehydrorhamnose reductase
VINCAAYTNVDKAETDYDTAVNVNAYGPAYIANALKNRGGFMVHISTDYVYDGLGAQHAYSEDIIQPNPCNVYGRTKAMGERMIATTECPHMILRTSWLYSEYGNNFMLTMMDKFRTNESVNVVINQIGTPTYAGDLANFIVHIIEERKDVVPEKSADTIQEVYHYTNEGVASWYDFACAIKEYGNFNVDVKPCYDFDLHYKAERPSFSVLDKSNVKNTFGIKIPYWRDSLNICITNLMSNE